MSHRRCRKSSAMFLCGVLTLFSWQSSIYPVRGQTGDGLNHVSDTKVEKQIRVEINSCSGFVPQEKQFLFQAQKSKANVQNNDLIKTYDIMMDEGKEESSAASVRTMAAQSDVKPISENPSSDVQSTDSKSVQDKVESASIASRGQQLETQNDSQLQNNDKLNSGKSNNEGITKTDLELLARVIYAEARGEDFEGQVAVGAVVLNRLKDARFPKTIPDVVFQPGAFTAVVDNQIHLVPDEGAYRAAEAALAGKDPTGGALYYFNPKTATDRWIKSRPVIKRIGNHTFSI